MRRFQSLQPQFISIDLSFFGMRAFDTDIQNQEVFWIEFVVELAEFLRG